jgi:hypothetical protein
MKPILLIDMTVLFPYSMFGGLFSVISKKCMLLNPLVKTAPLVSQQNALLNTTKIAKEIIMTTTPMNAVPARVGWFRHWPRWVPYAVVVWSLVYAAMGLYWAIGGQGFPYTPGPIPDPLAPLAGRFGLAASWIIVILEGIPAVFVGVAMLRGGQSKVLRPFLIAAGVLLAGVLLVLMTGLNLLVKVGYIPAAVFGLFTAEKSQGYLQAWTEWATIHQLLCLVGGFLWLAATVSFVNRSSGACPYCGRRDGPEGWNSPSNAARWGRIALYVAIVAPIFYALTRTAWAVGIPLGMSAEALHLGQESGTWIKGLSLAGFGLVGVVLMLGLVQRWGEVFPRWMIGLGGRRVPIALAVIPASLTAVLLIVGGIGIWVDLPGMAANAAAAGAEGTVLVGELIFQVGPTLLFPLWGAALAVATLGYYYRRRGPCGVCGRGTPHETDEGSMA